MNKAGDSPYYNDRDVKDKIDEVLYENCCIFTKLGNTSTVEEIDQAKAQERSNLRAIMHLDPHHIKSILNEQ